MNSFTPPLSILAVIPAYNEGAHVASVVEQTKKYLPVLVIDDGSTDNTAAEAETAGAEVLKQRPNQGKGTALLKGFQHALQKDYSAVIMLDADGQHAPEEIPKFLDIYQLKKADLIVGQREFRYMPRLRRTTNTIGTWMFSWALGTYIPDNQSGFRLLSRRMMEATLNSRETNFEFEVEMIVVCVQHGYLLEWVPIRTIYGGEKSHIRPLRHAYHFMRMVWQTRQTIQKKKKKPNE